MNYFKKYGMAIILAAATWLFIYVASTYLTAPFNSPFNFSDQTKTYFTATITILVFISYLIYVDSGGGILLNKLKSVFPIVNLTLFILSIVFIVLYIAGFVTSMVSECPTGATRPGFSTGLECGGIFGLIVFPLSIAGSFPLFFITAFLLQQRKKYKQQLIKEQSISG